MNLFGPLPGARNGNVVILVFIDHLSKWVRLIALKKAEITDIIFAARERWMPRNGVPAIILSDNGPHFIASVVQYFCESVGARRFIALYIIHKVNQS